MPAPDYALVYWDASAILSFLFQDIHSASARNWAEKEGVHFISSLAWSEVCAVIFRLKKENIISESAVHTAYEAIRQGPWRRLSAIPEWDLTENLSKRWSLRGADLWHLAAGKSLQNEMPELVLLTFDLKLEKSVRGESLFPD